MSFFHHGVSLIHPYIVAYGAAALFVIIYLEALGLPLPGESAVIAGSVLAVRGDLAIGEVLLATWAGAVLGDSTGYAIGRVAGRPLLVRFGPMFKLSPERLASLEALFKEKGAAIVVTARFIVLLRQLNGIIAGSVRMPWPRFPVANAIGAALWIAVWGLGPYLFGGLFRAAR